MKNIFRIAVTPDATRYITVTILPAKPRYLKSAEVGFDLWYREDGLQPRRADKQSFRAYFKKMDGAYRWQLFLYGSPEHPGCVFYGETQRAAAEKMAMHLLATLPEFPVDATGEVV